MPAAYLDTRVSLLKARLWSDAQFARLIACSDAELPETLSRRGLATLTTGYRGSDPTSLETRIVAQLLQETLILLRPLTGAGRQFLLYWIKRFEVSNLKTLIRAKMAGERPAVVASRLLDMGPFRRLDAEDLMHAEDVPELFRRLEQSPYADIVRLARLAFEQNQDPFILDATLDRAYYEGLVERAGPLTADAGAAFGDLMACLVDDINLVWLLRYRFNYRLPPAQVYYLLVASRYRLRPGLLRQMVAQASVAAVLALLPPRLRTILAGQEDITAIAARLEQDTRQRAGQVLAAKAHPMARAFAYLLLRERNLRAVRAVLRGRHLHLPVAAIRLVAGQAAMEVG